MKFSEVLKTRLHNTNLTQVARELDIPKTLLHEWVHAKRVPSLKNIHKVKKLADYLSLSLNQLLLEEDNKTVLGSFTFENGGQKYRVWIESID